MLLKTFAADGVPQKIDLQTNANSFILQVKTRHTKATIETGLLLGKPLESAVLENIVSNLNGLVSITRYSAGGQLPIVQNIKMADLMEISAFGKSEIYHEQIAGDETTLTFRSTFFVCLSNFGSVKSDKSDFITFEYTNPSSSVALEYTLRYVSSYVSRPDYLAITTLTAQENQDTDFDCEAAYLLVIPVNASSVRIDSNAGESIELKGDDPGDLQLATTDHIHNIEGRMYRSLNWNAIDVGMAYRGKLLLPAKSSFFLLSNKVYQ